MLGITQNALTSVMLVGTCSESGAYAIAVKACLRAQGTESDSCGAQWPLGSSSDTL